MSAKTINCIKLKKEAPAMEKPPFPGPLGKQIFEQVSAEAWAMWQDMQIKVINEYRLNLGNAKDYATLMDQMLMFLNLKEGAAAEVNNPERGK